MSAGLQEILEHGALAVEVWVETVGLVTLHNFGRRVVEALVRLVVLVLSKPGVHAVEKCGLRGRPAASPR